MNALLDVNVLLACGWQTHADHARVLSWIDREIEFYTCPLVELGFLRVSIGPAFRARFEDAIQTLSVIKNRPGAKSINVDFDATQLPVVSSHSDVTDAYLVALAKMHRLRLATLDVPPTTKVWAAGVAFDPLASP